MTPAAVPRVILNTVASGGDEDTGLRCCLSHTAPDTAIGAPSLWNFVRHCPIGQQKSCCITEWALDMVLLMHSLCAVLGQYSNMFAQQLSQ